MHTPRLVRVGALIIAALAFAPRTSVAQDQAATGKTLFGRRGCGGCHAIGKKGRMAGPDLAGVTQRRSNEWLKAWLKSPDTMVSSDSIAKAMYLQYNKTKMPNLKLSDDEITALIAYLDKAGKASS